MGGKAVIVRIDPEPAVVGLRNKLRQLRVEEAIPEGPARGDPKANGAAELAVHDFEDPMRTRVLSL